MQIGWRGERIGKTPLQPYAFVAINTAGETNYGAIGLSAKFGDRFFIRPGLASRSTRARRKITRSRATARSNSAAASCSSRNWALARGSTIA